MLFPTFRVLLKLRSYDFAVFFATLTSQNERCLLKSSARAGAVSPWHLSTALEAKRNLASFAVLEWLAKKSFWSRAEPKNAASEAVSAYAKQEVALGSRSSSSVNWRAHA